VFNEVSALMRAPDFVKDGWCLEDGEELHREAPATFFIPDLALRMLLQPGDLAKLIFKIAVEGDEYGAVERMWVIVRERTPTGYVGMLDNEASSISENGQFWRGTELPFEPPYYPGEPGRRSHHRACKGSCADLLGSFNLAAAVSTPLVGDGCAVAAWPGLA
jgi:hypothetical protein